MNVMETWKPIPGYEGVYEASSHSNIRRVSTGRVLRKHKNRLSGRHSLSLSVNNVQTTRTVATLVCAAFHGPRPKGMVVAHWDGNVENDVPGNLRWATPEENEADKRRHGTVAAGERNGKTTKPDATPRGSRCNQSQLTEEGVATLRRLLSSGSIGVTDAARLLGISKTAVKAIKNRKTWRHVA